MAKPAAPIWLICAELRPTPSPRRALSLHGLLPGVYTRSLFNLPIPNVCFVFFAPTAPFLVFFSTPTCLGSVFGCMQARAFDPKLATNSAMYQAEWKRTWTCQLRAAHHPGGEDSVQSMRPRIFRFRPDAKTPRLGQPTTRREL